MDDPRCGQCSLGDPPGGGRAVADETPKGIFTVTEIELLLTTAARRGTRWAVLISLGLHAGLRLGEALGLTWNDVDLDDGVIRVRRQLDSQTGKLR